MDLMSNMSENQTKESPGRIMRDHYKIISPERHDSFREHRVSSLPEGKRLLAESKRGMM